MSSNREESYPIILSRGCLLVLSAENGFLNLFQYRYRISDYERDYLIELIGLASGNGHLDIVKFLVDRIGNQDVSLRSSIEYGSLELVQLLHNPSDDDFDLLEWAIRSEKIPILGYIMELIPDFLGTGLYNTIPYIQNLETARYILDYLKVRQDYVTIFTLLESAAKNPQTPILEMIVVDMKVPRNMRNLILGSACQAGCHDNVEYLLDRGVDLDDKNVRETLEKYQY